MLTEAKMKAYGLTRENLFNYRNLKDIGKFNYAYEDNYDMLLESVSNMFNFYNLPDTVNTNFIQLYALNYGMGCVADIPEFETGPIVATFMMCGTADANGLGTDAIVATRNGKSKLIKNWKESNEVEPFFLNRIYSPDLHIQRTAAILTEADTSINAILLLARYTKLLRCKDNKTKEAAAEAINAMKAGQITTFVSDNVVDALTGAPSESIENIDLTDVRNNDMIQYLSKFEDDVLREFFNKYGLDTAGASKMSQQSVDEINSGSNRSMVIPHTRLEMFKDFIKHCNAKFGWNASVEFSECWQNELAKCKKDLPDAEAEDEEIEEVEEEADEVEHNSAVEE